MFSCHTVGLIWNAGQWAKKVIGREKTFIEINIAPKGYANEPWITFTKQTCYEEKAKKNFVTQICCVKWYFDVNFLYALFDIISSMLYNTNYSYNKMVAK